MKNFEKCCGATFTPAQDHAVRMKYLNVKTDAELAKGRHADEEKEAIARRIEERMAIEQN